MKVILTIYLTVVAICTLFSVRIFIEEYFYVKEKYNKPFALTPQALRLVPFIICPLVHLYYASIVVFRYSAFLKDCYAMIDFQEGE